MSSERTGTLTIADTRVMPDEALRDLRAWIRDIPAIARGAWRVDVLSADGGDLRAFVYRMAGDRILVNGLGEKETDVVTLRSSVPMPDSVRQYLTSLAEGTTP